MKSLRKLPQVNRGFQNLTPMSLFPWREKAFFEMKHINTFTSKKGKPIFVFNTTGFTHLIYACIILHIYTLPLRKCKWQSDNSSNPKASNLSGKFPVCFIGIPSGCLSMLSKLLYDSGQTERTDEIFPWPYWAPVCHSLRAERQGVNEYLKRRQRDGRQRGARWKTTEQNAEVMGNS